MENVPYHAKNLSELLPDCKIIGLASQSVVDAVGYWQFFGGQEQRVLVSGMHQERTWEEVRGEEQAWEVEIFFSEWDETQGEPKIEPGHTSPAFSSYHLSQIGRLLKLPGFGIPAQGESWSGEIIR